MAKRDPAIENAIEVLTDIRHRWEEAWFGRTVTPGAEAADRTEAIEMPSLSQDSGSVSPTGRGASFAEQLGWSRPSAAPSPEREQDHGIDR